MPELTADQHAYLERRRAMNMADAGVQVAIAETVLPAALRLERKRWTNRFLGEDGLGCWDHNHTGTRLIHSIARELDGEVWAHLSISRRDRKLPDWAAMRDIWRLVHPLVVGVQLVVPEDEHVNIQEVLHLWGCLTARPLPDFSHGMGTI